MCVAGRRSHQSYPTASPATGRGRKTTVRAWVDDVRVFDTRFDRAFQTAPLRRQFQKSNGPVRPTDEPAQKVAAPRSACIGGGFPAVSARRLPPMRGTHATAESEHQIPGTPKDDQRLPAGGAVATGRHRGRSGSSVLRLCGDERQKLRALDPEEMGDRAKGKRFDATHGEDHRSKSYRD